MDDDRLPVCDYEGSDYRDRFWEGQGRQYEDSVERLALRHLLPPGGDTLIELGAGFGRLAAEYSGYRRVVLFDYSRSLLREAQARLGPDPRYIYVAGNWYDMPFVAGLFETMVQVRTLHHAADVPRLFAELARIARPGGTYVLEFANKRNLKAMARYLLRRQRWSPFTAAPVEFVELNFVFHPRWIEERLRAASFTPGQKRTVSHFRLGAIKRLVPTPLLARADRALQPTGQCLQVTPSVFVRSAHPTGGAVAALNGFFACPVCLTPLAESSDPVLHCGGCGREWGIDGGLYDFKAPR
ncbi:MAG: class I SAM-dependent methyltransferase [Anaerolineae bacterium]|nr:class I SAM-dependent methyltransferase [Anaerolineae bacterium]